MKKLALYGLGNRCGIWHGLLMREYQIVCFVSDDDKTDISYIKNVPVICKHDLGSFEYDYLVILTDGKSDVIFEDLIGYITCSENVLWLDEFLMKEGKTGHYEQLCVKEQKEILKEVLLASDEEIHNYEWMYDKVIKYGLYCFRRLWLDWSEEINWTVCGIQQMPDEFARFCIFLSDMKIKTALDIGVFKGRSSYFVCAILMRKNPELSYTMVDIEDRLDFFDEYCELLPPLRKKIPGTSDDYLGHEFDYVFIDANHSYEGSIRDYENVGKNARIVVAFHDIYGHEYDCFNGGTVRTWNEVMEQEKGNRRLAFSKYPNEWMGIGVILKEQS